MKITNPITLDVARSNSYICLLAKQFDSNSRYLEITLADNGQPLTIPADASVVLRATRADGTGAVVSGTVADGKAAVEIDDYILEVAGAVTLSLEISKGGEILTTTHCNLTVQKADASGWIRVYIADSSKAAGNYYITIGGVSYSFTTSQAIPAGGSVYFSSNNATAETRNATGTVIETGLVLTEGTTGTQLVTDVPTMSFLATIAGRVAALESEMPNKADKDGIIALANNLTPYSAESGVTQAIPFINQGAGCGNGESVVDTGSYLQFKKKLGNTVSVNNLANVVDGTSTVAGVTITKSGGKVTVNGLATDSANVVLSYVPIVKDRKYLLYAMGAKSPFIADDWNAFLQVYASGIASITIPNGLGKNILWGDGIGTGSAELRFRIQNGVNYDASFFPVFSDQSLWYGSTSSIPSHLLSHPEDFGRYYSGSLAYNPGQLVNADGSILTSLNRQLFDKDTMYVDGYYISDIDGAAISNANACCTDYIEISPNTAYYIYTEATSGRFGAWYDGNKNFISGISGATSKTAPANARYMRFTIKYSSTSGGSKDTFTLSRYYSGESGYDTYYPYTVLAEVDTGSEVLRGVKGSRDEKLPNGTITRRRKSIDLGTLNYQSSTPGIFFSDVLADTPEFNESTLDPKVINPKYLYASSAYGNLTNDKVFCINGGRIWIVDTAYSDVATFKTAMSGVMFEYPLATPTTEQGTPFSGASADNFAIDDFGSMYWTQSAGVPQGVEIFYPYDYKAAVDTILNEVNGDVTKLVTAEKVPDAPSSNGTYVLKVTVSGGTPTYSWVAG